jgi:hypothetical protein
MRTAKWICTVLGAAAAAYAAAVAVTWTRYGRASQARDTEDADPLLDLFMPDYEVAECHQLPVAAPASITHAAATAIDLEGSRIVRGIIRVREIVLNAHPPEKRTPLPLIQQMKEFGWAILAEIPGREVVLGTVTEPWAADVVFRPIPPEDFAAFSEPGYVKIVTMLRADSLASDRSVARTDTRAATTDALARAKFRFYWSCFRPGIVLIRRVLLRTVKQEAERQWKEMLAHDLARPHASELL